MSQDDIQDTGIQRPLTEAKANDYEHVGGGMTLGTVCEHPSSGAWVLVIDIREDGRVMVVNLDEVPDDHCLLLEEAYGCVEHAKIGRGIAAQHPEAKYIGPPEAFDVLGPTHPDHQRRTA